MVAFIFITRPPAGLSLKRWGEMKKIKCIQCGTICQDDDSIWQVRLIQYGGERTYNPCCSKECAEKAQAENIELHRQRLHDVEHQALQKMTVNTYLGGY